LRPKKEKKKGAKPKEESHRQWGGEKKNHHDAFGRNDPSEKGRRQIGVGSRAAGKRNWGGTTTRGWWWGGGEKGGKRRAKTAARQEVWGGNQQGVWKIFWKGGQVCHHKKVSSDRALGGEGEKSECFRLRRPLGRANGGQLENGRVSKALSQGEIRGKVRAQRRSEAEGENQNQTHGVDFAGRAKNAPNRQSGNR